ncbi:MAG TPA: cellobiose phosphorylase [Anaerolineaceae bacterium]|nr:cellobiose phosphorylase [Anaerolineaceae bacterium]
MTGSPGWFFTDENGSFSLPNPAGWGGLYFPLLNPAGMLSSLTPTLNGDVKTGQNSFLTLPVSMEDLHNTRSGRNFWLCFEDRAWSVVGASAPQRAAAFEGRGETSEVSAGLLWHAVRRELQDKQLVAECLSLIPLTEDLVELTRVTLTNQSTKSLHFVPTAAVPIFGRSADNLRDHRHVTSLLHRIRCVRHGVVARPTMSFDERGHKPNTTGYAVLGADGTGRAPDGFFPLVREYIGMGGDFEAPGAVYPGGVACHRAGEAFEGYEAMGGLRFAPVDLAPGQSVGYILILAILPEGADEAALVAKYGSAAAFERYWEANQQGWQDKLATPCFDLQDPRLNGWLRWVGLQPTLRRIMGNSFLPAHDYGRGGRGWRDLWQDLLAGMLTDEAGTREQLINNCAGIRLDGSNATIVGSQPGQFLADRNHIPRVWMDHGAWPLLTIQRYLDQTGDLDLLLGEQTWFSDHLTHRCQQVNAGRQSAEDNTLRGPDGAPWKSSLLEHLLVQHLTVFFNVGEHNIPRLEGGDWNDGLDMAAARGESVAFASLYAANLRALARLCLALAQAGHASLELTAELGALLDSLGEPVDYDQAVEKQTRLGEYLDSVAGEIRGRKLTYPLLRLAEDLRRKADWLSAHIREAEWLPAGEGEGWFNGYYDNAGQRVEGNGPGGARMTLTGQVFPLMAGIATPEQARAVARAVRANLWVEGMHGCRLNTDFGATPPRLGRAFAFAFGHKENGALFNHMSVMYAYALYEQGLAREGWEVLRGIYDQSQNFASAGIYPGIPEYFDPVGRGMYPWLTGSASWYLLTLLSQVFGIHGDLGDLVLEPKFCTSQFDGHSVLIARVLFAGRQLTVVYHNPMGLGYPAYRLGEARLNGRPLALEGEGKRARFSRGEVTGWPAESKIDINLVPLEPEAHKE